MAIELEKYIKHPGKEGYLKFDGMETPENVFKSLEMAIKSNPDYNELDYFSLDSDFRYSKDELPSNIWRIACFPVQGSNEGYYMHVDFMLQNGKNQTFALGKTLYEGKEGLRIACSIANDCAKAFII
jgi:hypothetical protein